MNNSVAMKVLLSHVKDGEAKPGSPIGIRIDQTLTQDSTGTMAYLQFEAMGIDRVKTDFSIAYIDHNMLQEGFENADDHKYIQTVAYRHGIHFSRPGNGICHQVHLERYGKPGATLLGSDSHTPTGGALGMIAVGAGGLDVAVAMGGGLYYINTPEIVNIKLTGRLQHYVTAKDIILEVLRRLSVKGGVGRIIEYTGEGINGLTIPQRATITNMGAELGATTSIFPSDFVTRQFLRAQGREQDFTEILPDEYAEYAEVIEIDLSALEPLAACPHSPDNVVPLSQLLGKTVDQIAIGSCTNGSFADMMMAASILKGKTVHKDVSLVVSPGSKQALTMLAENGALSWMLAAGARVLESGCGPCIGMGQAPATNAVSLRTFNRNFKGRCGTESAEVYLVSPEVAAYSAVKGQLADPRDIGGAVIINQPESFLVNDNMVIAPSKAGGRTEVVRGPNIMPFPLGSPLEKELYCKVLLKAGDNITTDHIMPSNAKLLPYRSNIPYLSGFCLTPCDADFPARAIENGGGIIVAGENYGQGSSREHAALVPLYLNVRAVVAKSFARIHKSNLINSGIIPLTFKNPADYNKIALLDEVHFGDILAEVETGGTVYTDINGREVALELEVSDREREMLLCGGKINWVKGGAK